MPLLMCRWAACSFNLYRFLFCLSSNNSQNGECLFCLFLLLLLLIFYTFLLSVYFTDIFFFFLFSFFSLWILRFNFRLISCNRVQHISVSRFFIFYLSLSLSAKALRSMLNNIRWFYYFDHSHALTPVCAWLTCSLKEFVLFFFVRSLQNWHAHGNCAWIVLMIECVSFEIGYVIRYVIRMIHQDKITKANARRMIGAEQSVMRAKEDVTNNTEQNDSWSKVSNVNYFMDFDVCTHEFSWAAESTITILFFFPALLICIQLKCVCVL